MFPEVFFASRDELHAMVFHGQVSGSCLVEFGICSWCTYRTAGFMSSCAEPDTLSKNSCREVGRGGGGAGRPDNLNTNMGRVAVDLAANPES